MRASKLAQSSVKRLAFDVFTHSGSGHQHKSIAFLHGILGNKKNWRTPAKEFLKLRPEYTAVTIDHRAHGGSW
jgi:pimeloyl-ACP methyl ester carboxylesterase